MNKKKVNSYHFDLGYAHSLAFLGKLCHRNGVEYKNKMENKDYLAGYIKGVEQRKLMNLKKPKRPMHWKSVNDNVSAARKEADDRKRPRWIPDNFKPVKSISAEVPASAIVEDLPIPPTEFELSDHRKSNPGLHLLYTKQALQFLVMTDRMIAEFDKQGNVHCSDFARVLIGERKRKIVNNAAFDEAYDLLRAVRRAEKADCECGECDRCEFQQQDDEESHPERAEEVIAQAAEG